MARAKAAIWTWAASRSQMHSSRVRGGSGDWPIPTPIGCTPVRPARPGMSHWAHRRAAVADWKLLKPVPAEHERVHAGRRDPNRRDGLHAAAAQNHVRWAIIQLVQRSRSERWSRQWQSLRCHRVVAGCSMTQSDREHTQPPCQDKRRADRAPAPHRTKVGGKSPSAELRRADAAHPSGSDRGANRRRGRAGAAPRVTVPPPSHRRHRRSHRSRHSGRS